MISLSKLATLAAAVLALTVSPAINAQSTRVVARVNVPFAFEVENQHFEPGVYTMQMLTSHILAVRGLKTGVNTMVANTEGVAGDGVNKVAFHKVGDQYFLFSIWSAGAPDHLQLIETRSEKKALRTLEAANQAKVAPLTIALLEKH